MEPKCVIGLSLQGSEHRRSQKFGSGAAEKQNVQTHGHNVLADTNFSNRSARNIK